MESRGHLLAVWATFRLHAQMILRSRSTMVFVLVVTLPRTAVLSWVASNAADPEISSYIVLGAPLYPIAELTVFRIGGTLSAEFFQRTLEFNLVSRTPLMAVMIGKTLAELSFGIISGACSLAIILVAYDGALVVAHWPLTVAGWGVAMAAISAVSLVFSPFQVLARGRGGFFLAIQLAVVALSGFVYPLSFMPIGLQSVARALPSAWAMHAMHEAILGSGDVGTIALRWTMTALLIAGFVALSYVLFRTVERRVRVVGSLSTT